MKKLEDIRQEITSVDKQMSELFEKRMQLSSEVLEYKKECGLPIFDPERESKILAASVNNLSDESLKEYSLLFFKSLMDTSKSYQQRLMGKMRVAYSGVAGAYAYIAARRLYPTAELVPYSDFSKAYKACEAGEVDVTILPMANSYAGSVGDVMDLAYSGNLYINLSADMQIVHNLVGVKGATLSDIKSVISHPQALSQCAEFIKAHNFQEEAFGNTALATKFVSEKADKSIAAIASAETAELYGLDIIKENINTSLTNTTRFAVFSRTMNNSHSKERLGEQFSLIFTVKNQSGALAQVLNIIGAHGFNMNSIHSRPLKNSMWGHYFFVEIDGDVNSQDAKDLMIQLKPICDKLKHIGSYKTLSI